MNKTTPLTYTSPATGKTYTYDLNRQTRVDYRDPYGENIRYEREYFQVNVYVNGNRINFGFVDDCQDESDVLNAVKSVVEWDETPNEVLESMHSHFD
jgi:hypothetical protein